MLEGGAVTRISFHSLSWANSREEPPELRNVPWKCEGNVLTSRESPEPNRDGSLATAHPTRALLALGHRKGPIIWQNKEPATMKPWDLALPPADLQPLGICHSLIQTCPSSGRHRGAPGHCPSPSAEIWAAAVCQRPSVKSQSTQQKTGRFLFM